MYFITIIAALAVCAGLVCGHASSPPVAGGSSSCQAKMNAFPFDPSSKCCTSVEGNNAAEQHPWAVLIEYVAKKTKESKTLCAGTLISSKYVLTAAQCVEGLVEDIGTPVAVRLGEFDSSHEGRDCVSVAGGGDDCNDKPIRIAIETIIPHQKYAPGHPSRWNDIALIRLKEVAPYTDFIRPICLPTKNLESNPPDHPLHAVTWYDPKDIKHKLKKIIEAPFVNKNKCKAIYEKLRTVLAEGQLCAGGIEDVDTCKGDSGGPLVYKNQGISELAGIVSFGLTPCGQKDFPSVYTNVFVHLDWIKTIIVA